VKRRELGNKIKNRRQEVYPQDPISSERVLFLLLPNYLKITKNLLDTS
jgi:hypothetical protein